MTPLRLLLPCVLCGPWLTAAELPSVATAVQRGLALVTQAASNWPQHKTCFSCHHQTLPMLSVIEAAQSSDPNWLKTQADITHAYFKERIEDMLAGEHVPGGATTVGYGFWALTLAKHPADDTTAAMVTYLLKIQGVARLKGETPKPIQRLEQARWTTSCRRPPLQGSDIADSVLALRGMQTYATAAQQPAVATARAWALQWLAQAKLERQEDRIWRLWGLHQLGGDESALQKVRTAIFEAQHADGGWPQADDLPSDAFSTGQTLFVLHQTGSASNDPVLQRARDWLLHTQHADGSWLVESRVKNKAQPYFENGDPHGEHQFISTAATAWSVAALAQFLPSK